jgi:DNA helicase MCM9
MLKEVSSLLLLHARQEDHTSFLVSAQDLIDFEPTLGYSLIHFPRLLLSVFKDALLEVQGSVHRHPSFESKHGTKGSIKRTCHIRITGLPPLPEIHKKTISDIRSTDFHQFVSLTGTVVRTGGVRVLETSKEYQCSKPRCGFKFRVVADPEQNNNIPIPRTCPGPKTYGGGGGGGGGGAEGAGGKCGAGPLLEVPGSRECVDYQEIRIQDKVLVLPLLLILLLILLLLLILILLATTTRQNITTTTTAAIDDF